MSVTNRLGKLREAMEPAGVDAVWVSQPENRRYMSGFSGSAGSLFITPESALLATDSRYTEQAGNQSPEYQIVHMAGPGSEWFKEMLASMGDAKRVGFEESHVTVATHKRLAELCGEAGKELVPINDTIETIRAIKDDAERDALLSAIRITDEAFVEVRDSLEPGASEQDVAWRIEMAMRNRGAESIAFELIVASGPNGAMAHHRPSDEPIAVGAPIVIDIGARVDGYHADMTRTICIGDYDDQFRRIYDIVLTAQETAIATIEEGMTGDQADALARNIIEKAGHGPEFGHSLGHGVGLAVHEYPRLGQRAPDILTQGMIFTVEPGIYITGWGGVRIEDIVEFQDGRCRALSKAPKINVGNGS